MRATLAGCTLIAGLVLSACGSTTVVTQTAAPSSSSATTGAATSTAGSTASPTATASTSSRTTGTGAATPRCAAGMLALSVIGQQGATGHGELGVALHNTSTQSCHTFGYPGVLFLSRSGASLPTLSTRTTHDFFGPAPAAPLVLAAGATASFRVGVTHGISSSSGCVTAGALQVIPPDDTATLRVSIPGGAYECGTATVSPLLPGGTAYR